MAKTPKIRFKNFSDEWVENKAFNIFKTTTEKGYSNLPVLSASQEFGMIKRDEIGINISYDEKSKKEYKRVKPGQFVIHLRSFQGGFAHSNIEGITSPAYTILDFQDTTKQYDFYWKYVLNSEKFIKQLESVTYGIRDGRSISYDEFLTLGFNYPNKKEQEKIGAFFSKLDKLIALHQSKFEKLQKIKKSCLQNLFPQNNQNTPKIRFKNFSDEWVENRLEYYLNISNKKNNDGIFDKNDVLSVSGEYGVVNQIKFKGRSFAGASTLNYNIADKNDVIYTKSPLNDTPFGIIKTNKDKTGIVSVLYAVYNPKDNVYPNFIQDYFNQNERLNNYLRPLVSKGAKNSMNISNDTAISGNVTFPNLTEQRKISDFFSKLDKLISLHQSKFEKLQKIKKSCLQNMFV